MNLFSQKLVAEIKLEYDWEKQWLLVSHMIS